MTLENRLQWLPVTPRIDDLAPPSSPIEWWAHGCLAVLCKHKTHSWLRVLVLVCLSACNWIPTERPVTQPSLLSSLFSKISSERLTLSSLWGEGLVRELGIYTYPLLYLKCITNKVHHIAQGTLLNVMWQPGWEGNLGENGNMYVYSWVALLSTWNYHNIVNWPYSDIKYKNEKKKGSPCSSWNSILLSLSFLLPSFTFHSTGRCLTSPVCSLPLSCTGM